MVNEIKFNVGDEVKQIANGMYYSFGFYGSGNYDPYMSRGKKRVFEVIDNSPCIIKNSGGTNDVLMNVVLKGSDGSLYFANSNILELVNPPEPEHMVTI